MQKQQATRFEVLSAKAIAARTLPIRDVGASATVCAARLFMPAASLSSLGLFAQRGI